MKNRSYKPHYILDTRTEFHYGAKHVYLSDPRMSDFWERMTGKKTVSSTDLQMLDQLVWFIRDTYGIESVEWKEYLTADFSDEKEVK